MIWLVFALLTGAAVMAVLAPLAVKGEASDPAATDIAFFEEQIAEIEREAAEGRLDPAEAESAKTEAARRLLRAQGAQGGPAAPSRKAAVVAALAAIVLIPAVSLALYFRIGQANLPDMPLEARLQAAPDRFDLAGAMARIEAHLLQQPEDGRGFEVVAPFYLGAGRMEDAVHAFGEALRLLGPTAARHAALGEARMIAAQGAVTKQARLNFEAALKLDAALPMSRYYLGLAAAQDGEKEKASEIWTKLVADAPAGAAYVEGVRAQLDKLRFASENPPASDQGKIIAALPEGDRQAMIRTMVERLAGRLEKQGDDVEGWLKLIRAYIVLAEPEKARQALKAARKALGEKTAEVERVEALARELNIGG